MRARRAIRPPPARWSGRTASGRDHTALPRVGGRKKEDGDFVKKTAARKGLASVLAVVVAFTSVIFAVPQRAYSETASRAEGVSNGGFETGVLDSGWQKNSWCTSGGAVMEVVQSDGDVLPAEGDWFLKETPKGNGSQVMQEVSLTEGQSYWLTAQIYQTQAGSYSVGVQRNEGKNGDPQAAVATQQETGVWIPVAKRFTMWKNGSGDKTVVYTWATANTGTAYLDDVRIVPAADYTALEETLTQAKAMLSSPGSSTQEAIENLRLAVSAGEALADTANPDNVNTTQEEIAGALRDLETAMAAMDMTEPGVTVSGETFYIDAAQGDDSNSGTSPDQAWRTFQNVESLRLTAGGKLLLKAGCVWNGEKLHLINPTGTQENPVVLGRYGDESDPNPVINGNGNPWMYAAPSESKEDAAVVHIDNPSHFIVENLEVTNWEEDPARLMNDGANSSWQGVPVTSTIAYQQSKSLLTGILVLNKDGGDLPGVIVRNN